MKYIYVLSAFILSCMVSGCIEDPEMGTDIKNGGKPEITIDSREKFEITAQSVTLSGNIVKENGIPVIERGFCWGLKSIDENKQVVDQKGKGEFKATINKLKNDESYIICAYAATSNGKQATYYSETVTFSTNSGIGSVKNSEPKNIKATSALCSGKITYPGEGEIKDQGVYLSSPTVKDSLVHGTLIGTDSIACLLTDLEPETEYSVRVYVENTYGTFSDLEPITFTTGNGYPALEGLKNLKVGYTDAEYSAKITDEGDAPVTICGFCYGTNKLPTIADDTIICKSIDKQFTGTLSNLKSQTQYYVRAYATNKFGTSYNTEGVMGLITKSNWPTVSTDNVTEIINGTAKVGGKVLDIGNSSIEITGVCWSTTEKNPTIVNSPTNIPYGEDSTFTTTITGLQGGKTYYVRAYAKNKEEKYSYGTVVSFTTPDIFRSVATFEGKKRSPGSSAACSLSGTGYLIGGDLGPEYADELWAFDGNSWEQRLAFPGGARKWQTVIGSGTFVCVFGGVNKDGKRFNDLYLYGAANRNWEKLNTGTSPDAVSQVAGCSIGTTLYLVGGLRDTLTSEVWTYSLGWIKKDSLPERQCAGITIALDNTIYAGLGLINKEGTSGSKKLWSSTDANSWAEEKPLPAEASIVRAGVAYKDCIYVVDNNGKIWKYDPSSKEWTGKSAHASFNRNVHCMYVLNDVIYIGMGTASTLVSYDPVWDN